MSDNDKLRELINYGAQISGSALGGVLGFVAGGPVSAAAGSAIGALVPVATDFASRLLSQREKVRVGAGILFAYEKIAQYMEEGRSPRSDGFFGADVGGRAASDEILEGVLLRCRNEHEEKKLRYLGNIYANVAFMPNVSVAGANWLLQRAQGLTFRQLCMLSLIGQKEYKNVSWGPGDGDPAFEIELKQIEDLLRRDNSTEAAKLYSETGEGRSIIGLSRAGDFCFEVMGLREIPEDDLRILKSRFPGAFRE